MFTALLVFHILFYLLSTQTSFGQTLSTSFTATPTTPSDDGVDFATIFVWPALPTCVKDQLQLYEGGVANWIGCFNNSCLCSEKFAEAEDYLASDTLHECSYVSDIISATSILSQYCLDKGYSNLKGAIATLPYNTESITSPTQTSPGSASGGSSTKNLDAQSIIGIVFGILGFFIGVAAVWFAYKMWEAYNSNGTVTQNPGQAGDTPSANVTRLPAETGSKDEVQTSEGK